jgi:fatty acid desaturase
LRWLKSFFLIPYYYVYLCRHFPRDPKAAFQLIIAPFLLAVPVLIFAHWGKAPIYIFGWFVPNFLAFGVLGFLNTSWPHHPASDSSRIGNTRILYVPTWLQWLMAHQNLHLVHHWQPNIPWYEYPKWWAQHKDEMIAKGARVDSFTKRAQPF